MKKKSIKKLELKKVTVVNFAVMKNIKGGTNNLALGDSCDQDPENSTNRTLGGTK